MSEDSVPAAREREPGYFYFITPARRPAPGRAEEQGGFWEDLFRRKAEDVEEEWREVVQQAVSLVSQSVGSAPRGYAMDLIELSLGFSAKGQLAFIAEAGAQTSVKIVFKRISSDTEILDDSETLGNSEI